MARGRPSKLQAPDLSGGLTPSWKPQQAHRAPFSRVLLEKRVNADRELPAGQLHGTTEWNVTSTFCPGAGVLVSTNRTLRWLEQARYTRCGSRSRPEYPTETALREWMKKAAGTNPRKEGSPSEDERAKLKRLEEKSRVLRLDAEYRNHPFGFACVSVAAQTVTQRQCHNAFASAASAGGVLPNETRAACRHAALERTSMGQSATRGARPSPAGRR